MAAAAHTRAGARCGHGNLPRGSTGGCHVASSSAQPRTIDQKRTASSRRYSAEQRRRFLRFTFVQRCQVIVRRRAGDTRGRVSVSARRWVLAQHGGGAGFRSHVSRARSGRGRRQRQAHQEHAESAREQAERASETGHAVPRAGACDRPVSSATRLAFTEFSGQ